MNKKELSIGNYVKYYGESGYKVKMMYGRQIIIEHPTRTVDTTIPVAYTSNAISPDTDFALFLSDPNWNLIISDFGMQPYQYANMPGICLFFDEEDNICYLTMFPNFKIKHVHTLQNLLQIAYPQVKLRGEEDAA